MPARSLAALGAVAALAAADEAPSGGPHTIDPSLLDRPFDGHGGLSAGASSRLLYDYEEPYRSDVLDYLYKPNWGAQLTICKVEIGGDTQSTEGTEASHMRSRDDGVTEEAFNRGYETWLLREAKARNPDIITMGLSWGAPGWIGNGSTADYPGRNSTLFFSDDNILYHVRWAAGLKKWHNISLDWMGVWNGWCARARDVRTRVCVRARG